jgi:hypothetical protein
MSTNDTKESISPTFYARLFRTKVLHKTFLNLDLRFVLFWRKNIGAKAARMMLVKLTQEGGRGLKIGQQNCQVLFEWLLNTPACLITSMLKNISFSFNVPVDFRPSPANLLQKNKIFET